MKKTNETGRSMVEMLGVLAIIGVLSVGGIAGYTMAMRSYTANEILSNASVLAMEARVREGADAFTFNQLTGAADPNCNGDLSAQWAAANQQNAVPTGTVTVTCTTASDQICTTAANKVGNANNKVTGECNGTVLTLTYNYN